MMKYIKLIVEADCRPSARSFAIGSIALLACLVWLPLNVWADDQEYLYYRDVTVPAYQTLHEFFDLPDRAGNYEVTMLSDAIGPLTFSVFRVHDDKEVLMKRSRSYRVGNHQFHVSFPNPQGARDLIVTIANSNPAGQAKVSVYVVELPK